MKKTLDWKSPSKRNNASALGGRIILHHLAKWKSSHFTFTSRLGPWNSRSGGSHFSLPKLGAQNSGRENGQAPWIKLLILRKGRQLFRWGTLHLTIRRSKDIGFKQQLQVDISKNIYTLQKCPILFLNLNNVLYKNKTWFFEATIVSSTGFPQGVGWPKPSSRTQPVTHPEV